MRRSSTRPTRKKRLPTCPWRFWLIAARPARLSWWQSAIQDNARGDVVGDKTFGEGSVQKLIEVPDGSALILSVAKYYTSNGKVIQDTGITPERPGGCQ